MATSIETTIRCDVCGGTVIMDGKQGRLPHAWATCRLAIRIAGNNDRYIEQELCPSCANKIESVLTCK